ncbi:MAG: sulfite exporter TauE/SafE family protein [Cyclobacteriaceae bacterium]|nr:sulfite exporter TauE/SafE family protein [Cyclobacteriaceae bacterium]
MEIYILIISFFLVALVYSSVGFGGGSSYLALMAQPFFNLMPETIRPAALLCNIVVVTGGTIIYYREGKISWKEIWPFLVASVPMAFLGGYWKLKDDTFFVLLGFTLLLAAVFLWVKPKGELHGQKKSIAGPVLLGGGIGFLSGLVSIGGGIFLAPILHLLNWFEAKRIAALASVFILVNSSGGLIGQFAAGLQNFKWDFILPLLVAVLMGGQIGSRLSARKFDTIYIRRITAILILVAALNILKDHL